MKTAAKNILIALTIGLFSCSNNSNDDLNPSLSKTGQVSGNWTVTYYFDSGKDETHNYDGYRFNFSSGDLLEASNSSATYTGSWRIGDKSSSDDSSSNKLVITITGNKAMDDLQDDWLIVKLTDTEIWLEDDNISSNETLHFGR